MNAVIPNNSSYGIFFQSGGFDSRVNYLVPLVNGPIEN